MCMCIILRLCVHQTLTKAIVFLTREVKEKLAALVRLAHLAPGVSLVSWVSLVLKEMM